MIKGERQRGFTNNANKKGGTVADAACNTSQGRKADKEN